MFSMSHWPHAKACPSLECLPSLMQELAFWAQQENVDSSKPYNGNNGVQGSEGAVGRQLEGGVADVPCQGLQHRSLRLQLKGVVAAWLDERIDGPAHLQQALDVREDCSRKMCTTDALGVAVPCQISGGLTVRLAEEG